MDSVSRETDAAMPDECRNELPLIIGQQIFETIPAICLAATA